MYHLAVDIGASSGRHIVGCLENGVMKWYHIKESVSEVIANSKQGFAQIDCGYEEIKQERPESSHRGILQNFANAILFGEELISPGYDGISELTLSNAAYLSQWQGNREITLPFDSELFDKLLVEKAKSSKCRAVDSEKSGNTSYLPRWQVRW